MKPYRFLHIISVLYITFQLVSDATAGKLIDVFGFPVSITVLYFPLTFVIADVLTEVYGYAQARRVIWQVLLASVLAALVYQVVVLLPPADGFDANDSYLKIFGSAPRMVLGGWIAVWAGGNLNNFILAKMKLWTNGKYLWTRTIGSAIVGELANTALFYTIALSGILPADVLTQSILTGWMIKVGVEIILTPLTYWVVGTLKRLEQEDYYDRDTDFNPLIV